VINASFDLLDGSWMYDLDTNVKGDE